MSVRPDHVKKLRRGRKFGRGRVRSRVKREDLLEESEKAGEAIEDELYEDLEELFDDGDEKIIEERSAVYPKHHGKERWFVFKNRK